MNKKLLAALLMSTALLSAACGDDEEPEEPVDVEGCEHLREGPAVPILATTTGTPPLVANDHRRYDITLVDGSGGRTGSVTFAASEATDYVLYTSADVPVSITNGSGAAVEIEESTKSSETCTEIKGRHVVPLTVGTHTFTFGPTSAASVNLVIEEASHEGHEH
ncbi:hypothetical protein HUA74_15805 [Myxococcus sp. CA051A]|uniref:hypothetical protein n=1 Tax=unclassified Myxococcus TaxID=2648731 RepID=UPI00157B1B63|nr:MULTISPECIES: hypothetical protein [unclassified Myxococcus]NTX35471.1 hypothetical protein [Myxococcus sp. CA033]NTX55485.1 hypothetical protein [Myxococcus sp. CA039A]NTX62125.1 hypothetical protein [Myxococcus sp. CA051A]